MNTRLLLAILLSLFCCVAVGAQAEPGTNSLAPLPPPMPVVKSPVELFRELLAASPGKLERDLAGRPPEIRARLLDKIKEYRALPPDERELRLQITQLRWNLLRLLPLSPEQRAGQLAAMNVADRKLVVDRLEQWDRLSPEVRQAVLKYEATIEQLAAQTNQVTTAGLNSPGVPPFPVRPELPKEMKNFLKLPLEQRRQVSESFGHFFELSPAERARTMAVLSPPFPPDASNSLRSLESLSTSQRSPYLAAVRKFSAMSEAERQEFQRNAARWKELTPAERQAWRSLVNHLQPAPPLPQEIAFSLVPPPPPPFPLAVRAGFNSGTNSLR